MSKIVNQSELTTNNLVFNIVELTQRTTIAVTASTSTISDTANQFVSAGFAVGDRIYIRFASATNPNNGYATIATISAGSITVSGHTGTLTNQAVGSACSIQRVKKTFRFLQADGLSFVDGVSILALTSEFQTLWDSGDYDKYDFPYVELRPDAETIAFVDGWEPHDAATVNAIRDGAIVVRNGETGATVREYMSVSSPGFFNSTGQGYFWQEEGGTITNFVTQGYVNQLILIRDTANSIDYRDYFVAKLAEPGRTVVYYDLFVEQSDIELLAPKKYTLFMQDSLDLVLSNPNGTLKVSDATIASSSPYTSITYTRHSPAVSRTIEGSNYNFSATIARTGATKEQVHQKLNWLIRQSIDIDSGTANLIGRQSPVISSFVGSEVTYRGFADGTPASERNESIFLDALGNPRRYDTVAAFTIDFVVEPALQTTAKYTVYLASVFNTSGATPLLDGDSNPVTGTLSGDTSVSKSVRYGTFNQFGHPPGTPIPITVSLSAPGEIRPQSFDFTINNNTTQTFRIQGTETTAYRDPL